MKREARWFVAAVVVSALWLGSLGRSQESAPALPPVEAGESDSTLREQTIYIPYENLRKTFEKEGRGVFLPYEKFRSLWDAARAGEDGGTDAKPPRGALITQIESEASVRKDVVEVRAELKIEVLGEGWHEIPLRLADAAITEARLGNEPARLLADDGQGYRLLVENPDDKAQQLSLNLVYAKGISRTPGQNSVAFQTPQAPVNRWKVRIPEAGVKVDIHPMIAATEVTEEGVASEESEPGSGAGDETEAEQKSPVEETVILAFVGAAPEVRIAWTPKAEGATGLAALASVQAEQQVFVGEGVTRTQTQLAYTISRAELSQLVIAVPGDQKVVNVFDANVRQWSVEADGQRQKITVQLFEAAKGNQNVTLEMEKFIEASETAEPAEEEAAVTSGPLELAVPVVEAVGVGRQQGVVVVQVGEGLRAEALRKVGLVQLDAGELPAALSNTTWGFSYRYVSVPYELTLDVEKIEPRITADTLVEARLDPERLGIAVTAIYHVERAGVFRLEMDVPEGFTVRTVEGRAVGDSSAAEVDSHHLEGDNKTRLVVSLARKAFGRVGLFVFMDRRLEHPELLTPSGVAAKIAVPVPLVPAETVERATGRLVVYAPESLRINPMESPGLRSVSLDEALAGMSATQGGGVRGVLAYAFGEEPPTLAVDAERRKPQVTVRQLLVARVEDGVTKYESQLFYEVLYSGIKSLRIDVPEEVAGLLRNKTKTIREQVIDPAPEDVAEGCVAWSLTGATELLGAGRIDLTWESKMEKLEAGSSLPVDIPRIHPKGVDRTWGQIVLTKAETIDLSESEAMSGLRPIDPQRDLIDGTTIDGAVRAFEYRDDWKFQLTATRYDLEDIKQTSIAKALLRMVVTRSGKTSVQALYRIRSSDQRLELRMPEESEFDTDPRIDGRSVTMETGQKRSYFIPLLGTQEDKPFLLELRYTLSDQWMPIAWPEFPTQPAVQKVYLCVYLPNEIDLLETSGPWTREFRWGMDGEGNFEPVNATVVGSDTVGSWPRAFAEGRLMQPRQRNDVVASRLLDWVSESVSLSESFTTDGRLFVFSTLQPGSPVDDGLRLMRLHRGYVNTAVMLVVVLAGLLMLPMAFSRRVCVVGVLAIGLVFCAVFWPLALWNVCDRTLTLPLTIVVVMWVIQFLAWTLPSQVRGWYRSRPARESSPPEAAASVPEPDRPATAEPGEGNEIEDTEEGGPSDD